MLPLNVLYYSLFRLTNMRETSFTLLWKSQIRYKSLTVAVIKHRNSIFILSPKVSVHYLALLLLFFFFFLAWHDFTY